MFLTFYIIPRVGIAQEKSDIPQELQGLIKRNTSTAQIKVEEGIIGDLTMTWLSDELLNSIITYYCQLEKKSTAEGIKIRQDLRMKLETHGSIPFLLIIKPIKGLISSPKGWQRSLYKEVTGKFFKKTKKTYVGEVWTPNIILRAGNRVAYPHELSKILEPNRSRCYTKDAWGYILFKKDEQDGTPIIQKEDLSFSIEIDMRAELGKWYDVEVEFYFDLLPIPIASIIDNKIPAWNNALVSAIPEYSPQQSTTYYSQKISTSLSPSDIINILGLAVGLVQVLLTL